ncbi:tRNA adenosine deaminase-associated protein [Corynebacterium sp. P5875]|uniref:tRNA adenosine deaminase-associated protein n=1 Tax=Corynebacterium antarcticum TaxID=2800405 RepID=A0A9Q4CCJ7_9CORY|nr:MULTISPECIES: tRNA adenosine deaminase-associated protein [Corynebacterium]MBV7293503.1 tRNA adenosine deaminase-associated protein [Corynebacterium sp. TAE3-ERU16]MCK7642554.1 tRNA adenosine deaminase-associated protein [Corynebacterium antarcticum]MCX7492038.1 tRNA adenosine deaminase-associated protein [Corynebacterium antarcticum]MCX7537913.1 tRNA adenosine deaminase-associated protein [Corynebacterium antarcticum]
MDSNGFDGFDGDTDDHDDDLCFAVTVSRAGGEWDVREIDDCFDSIDDAVAAVGRLRSESASFAMLCVDDEYFLILRPAPGGVRLLLSDATMAVGDDLAAGALEEIGADIPELDSDELDKVDPWAEGDIDILADLGVSEQVMTVICDDSELWASEQLLRIAAELGFESELADAVDLDID